MQHQLVSTEDALRDALDQAQQVERLVEALRGCSDRTPVSRRGCSLGNPHQEEGGRVREPHAPHGRQLHPGDPSLKRKQAVSSWETPSKRLMVLSLAGPLGNTAPPLWLPVELHPGRLLSGSSPPHPSQTMGNSSSANGIHQPDKAHKQEVSAPAGLREKPPKSLSIQRDVNALCVSLCPVTAGVGLLA